MFRSSVVSSLIKSSRQFVSKNVIRSDSTLSDGPIEKSLNQVLLLGRVGADPALKGSDAHPVVLFSIATNTSYRSATDGLKQRTEWHKVSLFKPYLRDLALANLKKGSRILVTGRISYGEVVDVKGIAHQSTTIIADELVFLSNSSRQMEEIAAAGQ